jgi:hypothetical protein
MQLRHEFGVANLLEPINLASEFLNIAVEFRWAHLSHLIVGPDRA